MTAMRPTIAVIGIPRAIQTLRAVAVVTLIGFAAAVAERGDSRAAAAGLENMSGLACALALAVARAVRAA